MNQSTVPRGMRAFTIIWIGQIVSLVGSGLTCFAQSIHVYQGTGSVTHLSLLTLMAALPGILISPLAGALVDRWDRRWVMIISDTVAAGGTLVLRLLLKNDALEIWHLYVITAILSIANHFQWPAYFATISLLVKRKNLGYANGMIELGRSLGQIMAPFMAGVLVVAFALQGVVLFDLGTYIFALITLLIVRIPKPEQTEEGRAGQGSLWAETVYGWKYLYSRRGLFSLLILFAANNFLLGIVGVLILPLSLSLTSITAYGSMRSLGGVGMLIGSLVMAIWGGPKRRVLGVLAFMLVEGFAVILGGILPSVPLLFAAVFIFFLATPIVNGCSQAIWQTKVAPDVQGRVMAASSMIMGLAPPLAFVLAGPLADSVFEPLLAADGALVGTVGQIFGVGEGRGIGLMFVMMGCLSLMVTTAFYFYPRLRNLEDELPDAVPQHSSQSTMEAYATYGAQPEII